MTILNRRSAWPVLLVVGLAAVAGAADWTQRVDVTYEGQKCLSYRARLQGAYLLIEASPGPGWHTFTMDNTIRAAEKLAGKRSLGTELPTEVAVGEGLELDGPWFQSPPKDFSKPEMRWYSWGYDEPALFAVKIRRTGAGPARLSIRGQVCSGETCRNIDVRLSLPPGNPIAAGDAPPAEMTGLVQVRR